MRWKETGGDNVAKLQLEPCMIFGSLSPIFMLPYAYLISLVCLHLDEVRTCQNWTSGIFPQKWRLPSFGKLVKLWGLPQCPEQMPLIPQRLENSWNWAFFQQVQCEQHLDSSAEGLIYNMSFPTPIQICGSGIENGLESPGIDEKIKKGRRNKKIQLIWKNIFGGLRQY